jgi:phosphohistidine swiveling domain-containing protein
VSGRSAVLTPWIAGPGSAASPHTLGAKAARLRDLAERGIPVPPWIVLTTEAARAVLSSVEDEISAIADAVPHADADAARDASERIARLIGDAPWPRALRDRLREGLRALRSDSGLAVRSSAAGEDGTRSSYAGQLASLLYVRVDDVESAVRACWASAWSDRAILYRQTRRLPTVGLAIAVILQEMVESRVAGVAFTADPLTGSPVEFVVAGYGLGDGIVSDQAETDEFVRRPAGDGWHATVRQKTRRSVRHRGGEPGTEIVPVPAEIQEHPAVTLEELDTLGAYLLQIERAAGRAQDVEWAIDGRGVLFILQARPITASPDGRLALWDDGNIGESYPGITLPLTYSYVRLVYERIFTRALLQIGVPRRTIERASTSLGQLVGTIGGRLYLNVLELYRLYALVPGLDPAVRRWEGAFGVRAGDGELRLSDKASAISRGEGARSRLPGQGLARLRTRSILALRFLTRGRDVRRLKLRMTESLRRFEDVPLADPCFEDLLERFEQIQLRCLDGWALVLFNDLYATYFSDRLARLCGEPVSANGRSASAPDLRHRLLRGETGMESIAPLRSVLALAREARNHPDAASLLRARRPDKEIWNEIVASPSAGSFRVMAMGHIRDHGHRVTDELKFEAASLHEAPWMLVSILRNYLDLGLEPEAMARRDRELRAAAEREYRRRFRGHPLRAWHALWILEGARRTVTDRENLALVRTRAHAHLRRLFRAMGDSLVREGALSRADDIFYLRIEELQAYARGGLPECGLEGLVMLRRARYAGYEDLEPRHRILCRGSVYGRWPPARPEPPGSREPSADNATLRGVPCSAGRVRGVARVIRVACAGERVDGEILVAPVTDPGWMFLMLAAKGLIIERGSVLSHTAIIGRELGIPTIVAVEGATDRIETGDEIDMDGSTGEILVRRRAGSLHTDLLLARNTCRHGSDLAPPSRRALKSPRRGELHPQ